MQRQIDKIKDQGLQGRKPRENKITVDQVGSTEEKVGIVHPQVALSSTKYIENRQLLSRKGVTHIVNINNQRPKRSYEFEYLDLRITTPEVLFFLLFYLEILPILFY